MPWGRPHASWLRQVVSYLKNMDMTGLALSGRWPDGGLSEGYGHDWPGVCLGDGQTRDAAPAYVPTPDLTL